MTHSNCNDIHSCKRLYQVDALRVLLCVNIVYFHILHNNIMNFIGDNNSYRVLREHSKDAQWAVELFFLISGYFLYCSKKKNDRSIIEHIESRILRLWPILLLTTLISVVFFRMNLHRAFFDSMFLQNIGLSSEYAGINWYISVLFWSDIFYYTILKNIDSKRSYLIIAVLVYFAYMVCVTKGFGRDNVYGVINLGLMRGIAGVGLGILTAHGLDCWAELHPVKDTAQEAVHSYRSFLIKCVITIIELICVVYLAKCYLLRNSYSVMMIVLVSEVLLISFIARGGGLAKLLYKPVMAKLASYTYSVYAMQQISFYIMQRSIWKCRWLVSQTGLCLFVSMCGSVLTGLCAYYLVERPCKKLGERLLK